MVAEAWALLRRATVAKMTRDQVAVLGIEPTELFAAGVRVILVTDGTDGATAITRQGSMSAVPPRAEVVETTRAGDAFDAAFIAELLALGADAESCQESAFVGPALRAGVIAGSIAVRTPGAMESLRSAEELRGSE